jgi:hypothetical protein
MDQDFPAADTICNFPMRTPESYNALVPAGKRVAMPDATLDHDTQLKVEALCEGYALNGFMRSLTQDGALPGLSLIYAGMGYTWLLLNDDAYSGIVEDYRGSFLWFGADFYQRDWVSVGTAGFHFGYDCSSNASHELGHSLFQAHAAAGNPQGVIAGRHDPEADCLCVMSYGNCLGEYCGFTLLSFRGWDVP